jgi:hypothetical protein
MSANPAPNDPNEGSASCLDNHDYVGARVLNNLKLPGAHVQGPQVCTLCKQELSTSPWFLFLLHAGSFLMAHVTQALH